MRDASHVTAALLGQKAKNKHAVVGIVRLPLAVAFTAVGTRALGCDMRQSNVDWVRCGRAHVARVSDDRLCTAVIAGPMEVTWCS